jgi:hypothetical protein
VCAFACFDGVRNTEAWKHNPLAPSVLYFSSYKGITSHINGDVILGGKLPHPM